MIVFACLQLLVLLRGVQASEGFAGPTGSRFPVRVELETGSTGFSTAQPCRKVTRLLLVGTNSESRTIRFNIGINENGSKGDSSSLCCYNSSSLNVSSSSNTSSPSNRCFDTSSTSNTSSSFNTSSPSNTSSYSNTSLSSHTSSFSNGTSSPNASPCPNNPQQLTVPGLYLCSDAEEVTLSAFAIFEENNDSADDDDHTNTTADSCQSSYALHIIWAIAGACAVLVLTNVTVTVIACHYRRLIVKVRLEESKLDLNLLRMQVGTAYPTEDDYTAPSFVGTDDRYQTFTEVAKTSDGMHAYNQLYRETAL